MNVRTFAFILVACGHPALVAAATPSPDPDVSSCTKDKETRTIEITRDPAGPGCQVLYTKAGKTRVVGEASTTPKVCDRIRDKLVKRLQSTGFECR